MSCSNRHLATPRSRRIEQLWSGEDQVFLLLPLIEEDVVSLRWREQNSPPRAMRVHTLCDIFVMQSLLIKN